MHGRMHSTRICHAGKLHVDRKLRRAVDFCGNVRPWHGIPNQPELANFLEFVRRHGRHCCGHRGKRCDFAVTEFALVQAVDNRVGLGYEGAGVDAPFFCRCLQQYFAHLGSCQPHLLEIGPNCTAAGDAHYLSATAVVTESRGISRRHFERHGRPISIEFFGKGYRHSRHRALAHLGRWRDDCELIVGRDADPGTNGVFSRFRCRIRNEPRTVRANTDYKRQAGRTAQEVASRDLCCIQFDIPHDYTSPAARCIADTMRVYVPQRQMTLSMCLTIWSRDGCGFFSSSSAAFII